MRQRRPDRRRTILARMLGAVALAAAGCVSTGMAPQQAGGEGDAEAPWFDPATVDAAIPAPGAVIGHPVGATAVRYDAMLRYMRQLAERSPFVTLTPYATSHEGRTLHYLTITSVANHERLDEIRAANAKLADPRTLAGDAEGERIIAELPGVAWLAYSIHGDELSSTDAALLVAHRLAAGTDETAERLRDELVVLIDPLQNPDGRERYLAQLQTLRGKVPNPDYRAMQHSGLWSAGRGNHYLFDLNRDWVGLVHPETRGRVEAIGPWNPHLVVDSHEMGSLDTYLFDPPREPINPYLSESNHRWRARFSADQAAAFDRRGWSYYTQEWYEEWYPGYTNAWANLRGAIGILYEQAGVNAAAVRQATGDVLTYRESVDHHYVSSMANLESLRANRAAVLRDFLADRQHAISAEGDPTFLLPPADDATRRRRFTDILRRQGIEMTVAAGPVEATGVTGLDGARLDRLELPAGTVIVRPTQPLRRLLGAMLAFDPRMSDAFLLEERRELENHRGSRIYDVTAWNLPMAMGLASYWAEEVAAVEQREPGEHRGVPAVPEPGAYGYLLDGSDLDVYRAIIRLLDRDCRVRVASKRFVIGERAYPTGSVLLRRHENPADLRAVLQETTADLDVEIAAAATALSANGWDLGGRRFHLLVQPRVAIASQWPTATTSFGATWHALDDRLGLRVSPINVQAIRGLDLREYNVLIMPSVFSPAALEAIFDEGTTAELERWLRAGGTLIAYGGAAAFLADADRDLSEVRLRRDVLDELEAYDESVEREVAALDVAVDPDVVWGEAAAPEPADDDDDVEPSGDDETDDDDDAKPEPDDEALERLDRWQRVFSPSGAIVATRLDPEHWLTFGVSEPLPVLVAGSRALMSKHPVRTPVRLVEADRLRLSGLLWPEARHRLSRTAYATVERVGNGQIVLFANDPFFRGYFDGTGRLACNAIILGPALGAEPAIPW